jgi:hypothetical protein
MSEHVSRPAEPESTGRRLSSVLRAAPSVLLPRFAAPTPPPSRRPSRPAPARAVTHRRRLLGTAVALAMLTLLVAAVGGLSWAVQILTDLIVAGYVWRLRVVARRAEQRRRPVPAQVAPPADPVVTRRLRATRRDLLDDLFAPDEEELAAAGAAADASWQPVPVPPPTYQLKPPAPQWAATYAADPDWDRTDPDLEPVADDELDDLLERRRAVGD